MPDWYGFVAERAGGRCEYCGAPEVLSNFRFLVDHVMPRARARELVDDPDNLALACPSCNLYKAARTSGRDPESGRSERLFHPRRDEWPRHFAWADDGTAIQGLTPVGRATVAVLRMNAPAQRRARAFWRLTGEFP